MASFEFISFIIGLLLGMIFMLLFIWIAYFTRTFLFSYCASSARYCSSKDYFNNPGEALVHNPQLKASDILFITNKNNPNGQEEMYYKRVLKDFDCTPQNNQTVYMQYPQYCSFSSTGGSSGVWRETAFNSNIYKPDGFVGPTIMTEGNCVPIPDSGVSSGIILLKWDPSPLTLI